MVSLYNRAMTSKVVPFDSPILWLGVEGDAQAYLHAKVSLLSGRDEATKCAISSKLLKTLQQNFTAPQDLTVQICVEIIEMPKSSYSKLVLKA